jgi:hypothetical protein
VALYPEILQTRRTEPNRPRLGSFLLRARTHGDLALSASPSSFVGVSIPCTTFGSKIVENYNDEQSRYRSDDQQYAERWLKP